VKASSIIQVYHIITSKKNITPYLKTHVYRPVHSDVLL